MPVVLQHDRQRCEATAAANHIGTAIQPVHDGVIGPDADLAVVGQHEIGKAAEGVDGSRIIPADRSARRIAAGHDEGIRHRHTVRIVEQQHLDRCIREHDANLRVARCCQLRELAG